MPSSYQIDLENGLVRCRAWGVFTHSEATATRLEFTSDPAFRSDFSQVYDFSEVARIEMTGEEIRDLGSYSPFGRYAKRAAIAPGDAIFGALRMFEIQHEASGGRTTIHVFRSTSEAEAWLGIPIASSN